MKKSRTTFKLAITIALLSLTAFNASATTTSRQVVKTLIVDGKIYPLINLPVAEVSASGNIKPITYNRDEINLTANNSNQMVMVTEHNGVFMPSVLIAEANVVANRREHVKHLSLKSVISKVFSFVLSYVAHFGVIQ